MSEDKALALLITSQDLELGPKARSGAGRPGRGSQMGGREKKSAEPGRHGGDWPPSCPSAGHPGLLQPSRRLGCSCQPGSHPQPWASALSKPLPSRPLWEPRPALARSGPQSLAEAVCGQAGLGIEDSDDRLVPRFLASCTPLKPALGNGLSMGVLRLWGRHPPLAPSEAKAADSPTPAHPVWCRALVTPSAHL